jgi:hypothetical protein
MSEQDGKGLVERVMYALGWVRKKELAGTAGALLDLLVKVQQTDEAQSKAIGLAASACAKMSLLESGGWLEHKPECASHKDGGACDCGLSAVLDGDGELLIVYLAWRAQRDQRLVDAKTCAEVAEVSGRDIGREGVWRARGAFDCCDALRQAAKPVGELVNYDIPVTGPEVEPVTNWVEFFDTMAQ